MNNINDFYLSILNIRNINGRDIISQVVKEQKEKLLEETNNLTGFCKYIASLIEHELTEKGITSYWLDLKELLGVDHVVLIAEFKEDNRLKRFLIDPTFSQFTKKEHHELRYLEAWPSEKIENKKIVADLNSIGLTEVDDTSFSDYLSGFSKNKIHLNLSDFLLKMKLEETNKVK